MALTTLVSIFLGQSKVKMPLASDLCASGKDLKMKVNFYLLCSPDEILKTIIDHAGRKNWDYSLANVSQGESTLRLQYKSIRGENHGLTEEIGIKYMVTGNKFIIVESIQDTSGQSSASKGRQSQR